MVSNPHSDFTTHNAPCQPSATCQFSPHVVQTAEAPEAMEEVQATEEAKGSIVEPSLVLEERAKGDHAEGVLWQ